MCRPYRKGPAQDMYATPEPLQQAIAIVDSELRTPARPTVTEKDKDAVRKTIAKDCNEAQFKVFVLACNRLGLDPFARQIVPIVQGGGMTPQTTIDGFRLIADRTHKYAGQLGPFWCGPDGEWKEVWLGDGAPAAAKVGVLRRDFEQPMWGVARFKSYNKGGNWKSMPDVMLAKVAESQALRKAFPQELSGAYTEDELDNSDNDREPPHVNETRTPPAVRPMTPSQPAPKPVSKPAPKPAAKLSLGSLRLRMQYLGIKRMDQWDAFLKERIGKTDAKQITDDELDILEEVVQNREAEAQAMHELGIAYTDDPAAPIGTSTADDPNDLSHLEAAHGAH